MVKIRLRRTGAKKQPHYRVVVADSKSPRDGKFIETIGHYNPRTEPPTVEIDAERALYWLGNGAQPSEAVRRMLDKLGILSKAEALKRGEVSLAELMRETEPAGLMMGDGDVIVPFGAELEGFGPVEEAEEVDVASGDDEDADDLEEDEEEEEYEFEYGEDDDEEYDDDDEDEEYGDDDDDEYDDDDEDEE
jgi:small subunit ribosomal protein S16